MKFEESSLTQYLVKNLQPLTEADPVILSEYVAALLKKDKPVKELQKLCAEKLVEFLGQATDSFIAKLFKTLEDGSVVELAKSLDATEPVELSASLITEDPVELKSSTLNPEVPSCESDPDEKEISDDDDDDRNHKHKRRETRSQSFDKNVQGNSLRRTNRRHNKPFENGQVFFGNDPQSSENQREYTPALGRDFYARIDKRRPGFTSLPRTAHDLGLRTRVNQAFHGDPGPHFDLSTSMGRFSVGRGRGRGSTSWNPHDLNFNANETFDFASQMPSQGPPPTSLFASRGLPQFGMIPGMANGGLDTLHPIGLQGALGPQINQPMNIGMLRQRCRDFEERGFCLRGDMCPMEHGVNRIVVEDVQSLSQFNLPVSLPSAHLQGTTPGAGPLHLGVDSSSLEAHTKLLHNKNNTHGIGDNGFGLNKVSSASAGAGEADLYDPDQPLWNNHSSPKVDDTETLWNGDASDRHGLRASDGFDGEQPGRSISSAVGSQSTSSSVWGRIGNSGNKLETAGKFDTNAPSTSFLGNAMKDKEKALSSVPGTSHKRKQFSSEDANPKATNSAANPRLLGEAARNNGRNSQKALRTVFVNGIPQKNNKRESLLSHFRKFGQVVDIYIPLNSEKAFVQFSKREEAEAALKAPDAVMGNRFIKLWWANRDSIPDSSLNIGDTVSAAPKGVAASVLSQPSIVDRRKESHSSAVTKVSAAPLADLPMSTAVVSPSGTNVPKVALSSQKKMDTLEVLKEELRIKQEMLDKKRNEFRRQLNMLEKKAVTIKGETTAEQLAKRHKAEVASPAKTAAPNPSNSIAAGTCPRSEKVGVKSHSGESIESPSSKVKSSPKNLKHPNHLSTPLGTVCVANRFKLDNRPTAFRILPPLPADFANVAMLKEHFSKYGDISAVELEDLGPDSGVACSEPSGNCAARITFTTRRSAEMAFLNGKCWRDQSLKFSWVVGHNNSVNSHSGRENSSTPTPKGTPDAEVLVEIAPLKSLAATSESISSISQDPAPSGNGEHGNPEEIKDANEPMQSLESCHSSGNPLSSCHSSLKVDTLIVEDGIDAENVL